MVRQRLGQTRVGVHPGKALGKALAAIQISAQGNVLPTVQVQPVEHMAAGGLQGHRLLSQKTGVEIQPRHAAGLANRLEASRRSGSG